MCTLAEQAALDIMNDKCPTVTPEIARDMRKILNKNGYFCQKNPRGSMVCVKEFTYKLVNASSLGTQVDLATWLPGQVVPQTRLLSYASKLAWN